VVPQDPRLETLGGDSFRFLFGNFRQFPQSLALGLNRYFW
jgi:hypothetical protein